MSLLCPRRKESYKDAVLQQKVKFTLLTAHANCRFLHKHVLLAENCYELVFYPMLWDWQEIDNRPTYQFRPEGRRTAGCLKLRLLEDAENDLRDFKIEDIVTRVGDKRQIIKKLATC
jgi:hypothetical protein